jgi:hypothetical protein
MGLMAAMAPEMVGTMKLMKIMVSIINGQKKLVIKKCLLALLLLPKRHIQGAMVYQ